MTTYINELQNAINAITIATKAGLQREERSELIRKASATYAYKHGEYNDMKRELARLKAEQEGRKPIEPPFNPPDSTLLERMTDLFLHEELTDASPDKASKYEYPFLSAYQLARRRDGSHTGDVKTQQGESPLKAATTYGQDLRDYKTPTRRKRSLYEDLFVDREARIKNAERRRKYNAFIAPGEVIVYKRGDRV